MCSFPCAGSPGTPRMDWRMGGRFAGGRHAPALDVTLRLAGPSPLWAIPFHAAASLCKYAARMLPATTRLSRVPLLPQPRSWRLFSLRCLLQQSPARATFHHLFSIPCDCWWPKYRSQVYYSSKSALVEKKVSVCQKDTPSPQPAASSHLLTLWSTESNALARCHSQGG